MNPIGAIIGGGLGGLIGAAVWAGIAYTTGYEIGWIAWGIGGLVGLGVGLGSKERGNELGVIAVVITILAILGGKYATVQLMIEKEFGSESIFGPSEMSDLDEDTLISDFADEIVEELEAKGTEIEWPEPADLPEDATFDLFEESIKEIYPPDIWTQAEERWNAKSEEEKDAYRDEVMANIREYQQMARSYMVKVGFMDSFGLMDLIFFALGIGTAYKVAMET